MICASLENPHGSGRLLAPACWRAKFFDKPDREGVVGLPAAWAQQRRGWAMRARVEADAPHTLRPLARQALQLPGGARLVLPAGSLAAGLYHFSVIVSEGTGFF